MMKMYGGGMNAMGMPEEETLVLNMSNSLVKGICDRMCDADSNEMCKRLAKQVYMLALVAQRPLNADELSSFIEDTSKLLADNL